ncbi:MAG: hypothetical protein JXB00_08090 [Bacteroidales bacterium]|nr:hypothetical protein [Bacteroidales bacterium]
MKKFLKAEKIHRIFIFFNWNCLSSTGSSFFMRRYRLLATIVFFTIFVSITKAQKTADYFNRMAFNRILYLQHDEAQNFLDDAKTVSPLNIRSYYLENYLDFLKCLSDRSEQNYIQYKENFRNRVQFIKTNGYGSDSALLMQAEMQFQTFILAAFYGERLNALKYFFQFGNQVESISLSAENIERVHLLKGFLFIILASVPDEYQWIISLMGMQGDMANGLRLIEEYHKGCNIHSDEYLESLIITNLIKHVFEKDFKKNYNIMSALPEEYLTNSPFRFVYVLAASRAGENDNVIKVLNDYPQQEGELRVTYFDYLLGEAMLNRLDKTADKPLKRFMAYSRYSVYIAAACRKLAWHALINGDTATYYLYRNKLLQTSNLFAEADLQAKSEFQQQEIPNVNLVKARLLFDGGYYSQAKNILFYPGVRENLKDVYQQIEYAYRLARIYHLGGEPEKAVKLYQLTCEKGWDYPMYYAAYSALQLGYIYENKGDKTKSAFYYRRALQSKNVSFSNNIHSEAKAGLKRLE